MLQFLLSHQQGYINIGEYLCKYTITFESSAHQSSSIRVTTTIAVLYVTSPCHSSLLTMSTDVILMTKI
jgi:hypothetical protein